MKKHKEVVAFTCGLLSEPSRLVEAAYTMYISENIHQLFIMEDLSYKPHCTYFKVESILFASLYRESNIPLPGHHFHNQFINYPKQRRFRNFSEEKPNHPIYHPSRAYILSGIVNEVDLGLVNKHYDITDSIIFICDSNVQELFRTCCKISEIQPITYLVLHTVRFHNARDLCTIRISRINFRLKMHIVLLPTHFMVRLMEEISQTSRVDFMEIEHTSLAGVKSFNLTNKAESLLHFSLSSVDMDQELCVSILRQTRELTNLKFLVIRLWANHSVYYTKLQNFCHIPTYICPQIFGSISQFYHLVHLDISGNNLTGCMPDFLSHSSSELPSLQRLFLYNTTISTSDVNHIIHIIETGKLPNLEYLNLDKNDLHGMGDEIDRLVNTAIGSHKRELQVILPGISFPRYMVEKWKSQCLGTHISLL